MTAYEIVTLCIFIGMFLVVCAGFVLAVKALREEALRTRNYIQHIYQKMLDIELGEDCIYDLIKKNKGGDQSPEEK